MTIDVQCEECFQSYKVRDERAGQSLKCKSCGSRIRVPSADEDSEDIYEDYGEPIAPTRKKKKTVNVKKKQKSSRKSVRMPIGSIVKKIFGGCSIALGALMLYGAISMFFAKDEPGRSKSRPVAGLVMAGVFLSVGKRWIMDD
ncbi:MAG: hypothetical protein QM501_04195 [Gimesia sp.]